VFKNINQILVQTENPSTKACIERWIRFIWLGFSNEKNRTVCSASITWGKNHHFHLQNIVHI